MKHLENWKILCLFDVVSDGGQLEKRTILYFGSCQKFSSCSKYVADKLFSDIVCYSFTY